uniref:Uncharacterized protein n=1 Tax=Grammatophora oceanica TaxID=210454 RepID=A0A7S1YJ75_9STRA
MRHWPNLYRCVISEKEARDRRKIERDSNLRHFRHHNGAPSLVRFVVLGTRDRVALSQEKANNQTRPSQHIASDDGCSCVGKVGPSVEISRWDEERTHSLTCAV